MSRRRGEEAMAEFAEGRHASSLLQTLDRFRACGLMCDVLLQTKTRILPAHRLVLAAFSPYFKTMFNSQLKESFEECIVMENFDPSALEAMISYAYTSHIQITESSAVPLFLLASFLQVTPVQDASSRFILTNLHPSNCLGIYKMADMHSYSDLAQPAFRYAQTYFDQVIEEEEFAEISVSDLSRLLGSRGLGHGNEDSVLRGVLLWVRHQPSIRAPLTPRLLTLVHLDLLTPNILLQQLHKQEWLEQLSMDSFSLLWDAYQALLAKQDSDHCPDTTTKRRLPIVNQKMVMLSVGGESQGITLDSMHCYHLEQDKWTNGALNRSQTHLSPMKVPRLFCSALADDTSVYVIGGMLSIESIASVERYDMYANEWTELESPMNTPRHGASASFLGGKLYVIGGRDNRSYLSSAEVYDPLSGGCWVEIESMGMRRAFVASVAVGGMLYAIGGSGGPPDESVSDYLCSAERYDPATGVWCPVAPMREARAYFVAVALGGCVYALGGYRGGHSWTPTVERYQPATDQWSYLAPLLSPRSSFGAAACGGLVFVAGGFNGNKNVNTVERYDPASDEWVMVSGMPARRYGMALVAACV